MRIVGEQGPAGALCSSAPLDVGKSFSASFLIIVVCSALEKDVKCRTGVLSASGNNSYVTEVGILAGQQRPGIPVT